MSDKSGFEGVYRSGESPKRRAEVLERLRAGMTEAKIAADLGIPPYAIRELVEGIRADGELPPSADA